MSESSPHDTGRFSSDAALPPPTDLPQRYDVLKEELSPKACEPLPPPPLVSSDGGALVLHSIDVQPSEAFLSSRMSSGFVIKCRVLLAHRLDQAVDGDAPPPSLPSPSLPSPPASDDQHAAPPHASIAPREPAAILRHFTTVFQPLLSRVVWEQLDEDEFAILPRSQTISLHIITSSNETFAFNNLPPPPVGLPGGSVMIDDHGITVTLTFSTCCAAAGASDFTALQSPIVAWDTWDSIGGLQEAEKQARTRKTLDAFDKCWEKRRNFMGIEALRHSVKELRRKMAVVKAMTAACLAECKRFNEMEEMQQLAMATAQRAQIGAQDLLKQRLQRVAALRDTLTHTNKRIDFRRSVMLRQLGDIFPIRISVKGVAICGLPLPLTIASREEEMQPIAAASALAQLVVVVSRYVRLPLLYPTKCSGSYTSIFDGVKAHSLYVVGKERSVARNALRLLLINVQMLLRQLGHSDTGSSDVIGCNVFRQLKLALGGDLSDDDAAALKGAEAGMTPVSDFSPLSAEDNPFSDGDD